MYYIIETCQPEGVIVEVKCIKQLNSPFSESKKSLEEVVHDIDRNGDIVYTATKNKMPKGITYSKGAKVITYQEGSRRFIRTLPDATERNNLDSLRNYC